MEASALYPFNLVGPRLRVALLRHSRGRTLFPILMANRGMKGRKGDPRLASFPKGTVPLLPEGAGDPPSGQCDPTEALLSPSHERRHYFIRNTVESGNLRCRVFIWFCPHVTAGRGQIPSPHSCKCGQFPAVLCRAPGRGPGRGRPERTELGVHQLSSVPSRFVNGEVWVQEGSSA